MQQFTMPGLDNDALARHLSLMVQCKTVSFSDASHMNFQEFHRLHAILEEAYPLVHQTLEKTVVNGHGLLYRFKGSGSGLEPILLTAHQDVVPVEKEGWQHEPFSGEIADGFVWGRGAIDCKSLILGHMEAIEALLRQGFVPDRDIYLAYGFDEEVLGFSGAKSIAEHLNGLGVHFDLVLDEGASYVRGEPYGLPGKVLAQVGIFEKGYVDLQLAVTDEGGHASRPKDQTALGILCRAIDAVEKHPFVPSVGDALLKMYQGLLPHLPKGELRTCVENLEHGQEALIALLSKSPQGNALVRTTAAATMAWAAPAPNVLPQKAEAIFNLRLHDKDSIASAIRHFEGAISDGRVLVSAHRGYEPSKTSGTDGTAFRLLSKTIVEMQPDAIVVPNPVAARTDARLYEIVAENIYRFNPFIGHMDLRPLVHGTNERAPIDMLHEGVRFYMKLLWHFCSEDGRDCL